MTINNEKLFMEGVWDWAILDGCFGETKIKPTDIDGLVERNGKFLIIETKKVGVSIPQGQMLTFERFLKKGDFTVLVMWGEKSRPIKYQLMTQFKIYEIKNCTLLDVRKIVAQWFRFANRSTEVKELEILKHIN